MSDGGLERFNGRKIGIQVPKFWCKPGKFWRRGRKILVVGADILSFLFQIEGGWHVDFAAEWRFFGQTTGGAGQSMVIFWLSQRTDRESTDEFLASRRGDLAVL